MLTRACAAAVPTRWVVADSFYGRSHALGQGLEQQRRAYVLMLAKTLAVEYRGARERAEQIGARLPEEACSRRPSTTSCGTVGRHQWACLMLTSTRAHAMGRWLLTRRTIADPSDLAYFLAYGPAGSTPDELWRVSEVRWQIEAGFAQLKGELGLDQPEVRRGQGWHRFVTLCLLAHAYLVVLRWEARRTEAAPHDAVPAGDLLPLTVPEVRRRVLALAGAAEQRAFGLRWSRWRRKYQAGAARSRGGAPGTDQGLPPVVQVTGVAAVPSAGLPDAEWAVVQPLVPPQRPTTGRPRHDHRTVLSGIVWVLRRRASWRALPKACGKWETAYKRYQLWCREGRWQRIAGALGIEDCDVAL